MKLSRMLAILAITAATMTSGCLPRQATRTYPYTHRAYDVTIAWDAQRKNSLLRIEGVLKNTRFATMDEIEVTVRLLDREGKELATDTHFITGQLRLDEEGKFLLALPREQAADKLSFFYRYSYTEGESTHGEDFQSFEAKLPSE